MKQVLLFTTHGLTLVFDFEKADGKQLVVGRRVTLANYSRITFVSSKRSLVLDEPGGLTSIPCELVARLVVS